ncbi:DegT/DnrJ/EryC1/StrS family aminotransferase [Candidatus Bathyarchaeota archaeon]|nr:DegT/DnrJ/EryC1/StrS family aminotransferase [Candidatus Bathyarchaeota archaeon]
MVYKVPFVNYPEHYSRMWDEVISAISEALSKGDLLLRGQLRQFEEDIASFVGVKYAVGLNSGTDAMLLSLKAAGVGPGDEVITVAHTFVATIAVIVFCGAKPVLVDVGEDMNMNVEQVEQKISKKTKAVIPVHLNGRLCNMKKLMEIADEHNLVLIEDAAQALGASFDGKKAGSFELTGCFSLYPAKVLGAAGDGGFLTTNDEKINESIRLLRDHGQDRKTGKIFFYGFNSRLDNIQAAILNVKLKYLPKWIERRRDIAQIYHTGLSDIPEVTLPPPPINAGSYYDVYQNYVIRTKNRDELVKFLEEKSVETIISWRIPNHFHSALNLEHFKLPVTEQISNEVISLPMYPELSDDQVQYVINVLHDFYEQR